MDKTDLIMPIHRALKRGDLAEVKSLIGDDAELLYMWTPFGTWLHDASRQGQLDIAAWCISQGLDVNAINDETERTPIDAAAANAHLDIVQLLLDSGAKLDTTDSVRNPLFAAIVGGLSDAHTAVARLLIERGIDTTTTDNIGQLKNVDALGFAREWGRTDIVKLLEEQNLSS